MTNVEFLKGEIEQIPLPDNSVDVIISNCVINLSADKDRVIAEAFRVLKPGGRFAVSDVVVRGEDVPAAVRQQHGALGWLRRWRARGEQLSRASWPPRDSTMSTSNRRESTARRMRGSFSTRPGLSDDQLLSDIDGRFMSAFVRARKPVAAVEGLLRTDLLLMTGREAVELTRIRLEFL